MLGDEQQEWRFSDSYEILVIKYCQMQLEILHQGILLELGEKLTLIDDQLLLQLHLMQEVV
jgi:hypothetical protein